MACPLLPVAPVFVLFGAMILCKQVNDINDHFLDDLLIMI